jgi:hypothetical protein
MSGAIIAMTNNADTMHKPPNASLFLLKFLHTAAR